MAADFSELDVGHLVGFRKQYWTGINAIEFTDISTRSVNRTRGNTLYFTLNNISTVRIRYSLILVPIFMPPGGGGEIVSAGIVLPGADLFMLMFDTKAASAIVLEVENEDDATTQVVLYTLGYLDGR